MTAAAAATRYARALFDVVSQQSASRIEEAQLELQQFADLLATNEALAHVATNPAIPVSKKAALAKALVGRAGAITPAVGKLIVMLAERDRLALLPAIARAFGVRVMDFRNIVRGDVTTAVPLPSETLRAIESALGRATGRKVLLDARVDPTIIGGVVTRLGSVVYDGSVTMQLQKMKQALAEAGR